MRRVVLESENQEPSPPEPLQFAELKSVPNQALVTRVRMQQVNAPVLRDSVVIAKWTRDLTLDTPGPATYVQVGGSLCHGRNLFFCQQLSELLHELRFSKRTNSGLECSSSVPVNRSLLVETRQEVGYSPNQTIVAFQIYWSVHLCLPLQLDVAFHYIIVIGAQPASWRRSKRWWTRLHAGTRGDPTSPLRWTCKSRAKLTAALTERGWRVSSTTVGRLLQCLGYRLQSVRKRREGTTHPDRNAQFEHINATADRLLTAGEPVISVDTKKKELVGNFANGGREWQPKGTPEAVRVHDFPSDAEGKAIPYGVYDMARNEAWVSVGRDHDTPAFAVCQRSRIPEGI